MQLNVDGQCVGLFYKVQLYIDGQCVGLFYKVQLYNGWSVCRVVL